MWNCSVWFTPTQRFWDWLTEIERRGIKLVDCGTGTGHLLDAALEKGFTCLSAVDCLVYPNQSALVIKTDARDIVWSPTKWPLMCRPTHGGWVKEVVRRAHHFGAHAHYIGLTKNYLTDLDGTRNVREPGVFGLEGEVCYSIPVPKQRRKLDHDTQLSV